MDTAEPAEGEVVIKAKKVEDVKASVEKVILKPWSCKNYLKPAHVSLSVVIEQCMMNEQDASDTSYASACHGTLNRSLA